LFEEGLSGNQALARLKELNISPRRQTFFNEWRSVVGYEKGYARSVLQPESKPPAEDLIVPSERYVHSPYTYRFRAMLYDPRTGEYSSGFLHLASDELLTIAEARAQLEEAAATRKGFKCESAEVEEFVGIYRRQE
jgi:hypothetical protein